MRIFLFILTLLLSPSVLISQKLKQKVLSEEEQWKKDSTAEAEKFQQQWIADSIKFENEYQKQVQAWKRIVAERYHPKDSLDYVDKKARLIFANRSINNLDTLVAIIQKNFKTPLHKARAAFYWICTNIKYDSASLISNSVVYHNNVAEDAQYTFNSKSGVCAQYASLFQYIATGCGLQSKIIQGFAKVLPDMYVSYKIDHAWNLLTIGKRNLLLDVTWGDFKDDEIESFWFDTPPDIFIHSHFPKDSSDQLLKNKISFSEFQSMPIVTTSFFLSNIPFQIPSTGYFSNNTGILEIEAANTKKSYSLNFTAYPVMKNESKIFTSYNNWISIPYKIRPGNRKGFSVIEVQIPGNGSWWIKLDITENFTINKNNYHLLFPESMIFQVTKW